MSRSGRFAIALAVLTFAGLALRLWNIDYGLPVSYHPDEMKKAFMIDRFVGGKGWDLSMHPLEHPGVMLRMMGAAVRTARALGVPPTDENILLTGRILAALCLTATIAITGLLGATLRDRRAGLLAAAIAAFSPELVVHSRYLKEDAFLTFFTAASALGAAWWINQPGGARRKWALVLCAAAAGLTAGTKFVGFFVPGVILLHSFFKPRATAGEKILFTLVMLATFAAGSIIFATQPGQLKADFQFAMLRGANPEGTEAPLPIYNRHDLGTYLLFHGIDRSLGWPLTLLGLWAVARAVVGRRDRPAAGLVGLLALALYFSADMTTLKLAPDCERYILPCIPLLAALAAELITGLRGRYWPALGWIFAAALALHSAALTQAIQPDTRELAARWFYGLTHGRPGRLAYVSGPPCYQMTTAMFPDIRVMAFPLARKQMRIDASAVAEADVLTISEFSTARFENYPRMNPAIRKDLKKLREEFPYAKIFRKPWYARMGFHNPTIEMRFRTPIAETDGPS